MHLIPDDEALCSGGLIMRAKKTGQKVFVFYVSIGGSRQFTTGQTIEDDRIQEAINASKYGGFEYKIGFRGTSTKVDTLPQKQIIEAIEDTIQDFKPDMVVIPYRESYSQDHRAVAEASISALRPIPLEFHHQPQVILEVEEATIWPKPSNPNFYVDISDFMEEKLKLYQCHKTQKVKEPHVRSLENLRRLAGFRGSEIGVKYAEAYNLVKGQI